MMGRAKALCNTKLEFPVVLQSYLCHPKPTHFVLVEYITALLNASLDLFNLIR